MVFIRRGRCKKVAFSGSTKSSSPKKTRSSVLGKSPAKPLPALRKIPAKLLCAFVGLCLVGAFYGGAERSDPLVESSQSFTGQVSGVSARQSEEQKPLEVVEAPSLSSADFDYSQIPAFSGDASVQVNGNVPYFSAGDIQYAKENPGYENYGKLDDLGRCTAASASVGKETMPAEGEKRGSIGQIKPTGWYLVTYDSIADRYLYNRCHLIGWQLTNENANFDNLITGTRFLNVEGMLKYEDIVAAYVKSSGNHVLYRVTPVFVGDELVARGVLMEAHSVEDDGAGLQFCVWAYNVQPGISINYADGSSQEVSQSSVESGTESSSGANLTSESSVSAASEQVRAYILNTNTRKFHLPSCKSVAQISAANCQEVESTRSDVVAQGYVPCKRCNP